MVKNLYCSPRGPKFSSQLLHGTSQLLVNSSSGDLTPPCSPQACGIHRETHKYNFFIGIGFIGSISGIYPKQLKLLSKIYDWHSSQEAVDHTLTRSSYCEILALLRKEFLMHIAAWMNLGDIRPSHKASRKRKTTALVRMHE